VEHLDAPDGRRIPGDRLCLVASSAILAFILAYLLYWPVKYLTRRLWVTLLLSLLMGVLTFVQMTLLGIPGAFVIGLVAAFLALIPMLGGIFIMILVTLVALVQGSTALALSSVAVAALALITSLIIEIIVWNVVYPKLAGKAVSVPISIILPGVIVGRAAGGMWGTFLSAPLLGIAQELVAYLLKKICGGDPYPTEEAV